jgi:nucleoid-associated protein YgaU
MARTTKKTAAKSTKKAASKATSAQTVTRVERMEDRGGNEESLFERLSASFQKNQSFFNIVLGGLIVVVLGVLLFNYFNRPEEELAGPAQQTEIAEDENGDVKKENLPGNYTVKEGDTLFSIAQNYFDDGYKYVELVKTNNLANENSLVVGQVITIPKIGDDGQAVAQATPSPESTVEPTATPEAPTAPTPPAAPTPPEAPSAPTPTEGAVGGAENATIWGEKLTGDTYTVQPGDWLSKIAGRAYGDPQAYGRIAQANNISNPDAIEVGMVLKIPR